MSGIDALDTLGCVGLGQMAIERLDHLGIVARICREIGLAAYLDAQDELWG